MTDFINQSIYFTGDPNQENKFSWKNKLDSSLTDKPPAVARVPQLAIVDQQPMDALLSQYIANKVHLSIPRRTYNPVKQPTGSIVDAIKGLRADMMLGKDPIGDASIQNDGVLEHKLQNVFERVGLDPNSGEANKIREDFYKDKKEKEVRREMDREVAGPELQAVRMREMMEHMMAEALEGRNFGDAGAVAEEPHLFYDGGASAEEELGNGEASAAAVGAPLLEAPAHEFSSELQSRFLSKVLSRTSRADRLAAERYPHEGQYGQNLQRLFDAEHLPTPSLAGGGGGSASAVGLLSTSTVPTHESVVLQAGAGTYTGEQNLLGGVPIRFWQQQHRARKFSSPELARLPAEAEAFHRGLSYNEVRSRRSSIAFAEEAEKIAKADAFRQRKNTEKLTRVLTGEHERATKQRVFEKLKDIREENHEQSSYIYGIYNLAYLRRLAMAQPEKRASAIAINAMSKGQLSRYLSKEKAHGYITSMINPVPADMLKAGGAGRSED